DVDLERARRLRLRRAADPAHEHAAAEGAVHDRRHRGASRSAGARSGRPAPDEGLLRDGTDHERVHRRVLVRGRSVPVTRAALACALTACSSAPARLVYPPAPRADSVEQHLGASVADPYRWLETMDSPETRAWVAAENTLTDGYLGKLPGREVLRTELA